MPKTKPETEEEGKEMEQSIIVPRNDDDSSLISSIENIVDYYVRHYYPSRFEIIKAKKLFAWDEKAMVKESFGSDALSIERHGLIDSIHEAFYKDIINKNYTPKMIPLHPSKREHAVDANTAYDWMYHVSWFEWDVKSKVIYESLLLWDSYVFFGKQDQFGIETPSTSHVSFFEMFIEPMAQDFNSSRTKIIRKIVDVNDVISMYDWLIDREEKFRDTEYTNEHVARNSWSASVYRTDFTKIRDIEASESKYAESLNECCGWEYNKKQIVDYLETGKMYESLYGIDPEWSLVELIQVWNRTSEWVEVSIMINWYKFVTLTWYDDFPFGNIYYEDSIWSPLHRWVGHKLLARQRECDMYLFALTNGIKMTAFPDWVSDSWLQDSNGSPVANIMWSWSGEVYQSAKWAIQWWNQPFKPIQYISVDALSLLRLRLWETVQTAMNDIGINSYVLWWDGRVERVSGAFQERVNQSRSRLKTLEKSLSSSLTRSRYTWLEELDESFTKDILEKIDDDGIISLESINIKNIKNWFHVLVSADWFRDETAKDAGQNILNTVSGMWELLKDEQWNWLIDVKDFWSALASNNWVSWLKYLTKEQRLEQMKDKIEMALEYQKLQSELIPQQPNPAETPVQNPNQWQQVLDQFGNPIQPQIQQ